ncbi:MAG: phosphatase PAP2 family protein [Alphaproteobacteria bacterium]
MVMIKAKVFYPTVFILTVLILILSPMIDLPIAAYFYNAESGFYLKDCLIFKLLRKGFPETIGAIAGVITLLGIANYFFKKNILKISIKESLFLIISVVIGPGLIVNSILKNHSGRARPSQIELFGGDKTFTPAYSFADECLKNCSLASGHAAFAFWLTALAMIAPIKYRKPLMLCFFSIGVLISFTRIVQGGHFISDVFLGGLIAITCNFAVYRIIYHKNFEL